MRIGVAAPPVLAIPPCGYAGTERVIAALVEGLVERGHEVTLFASGDSSSAGTLVPTVPVACWADRRTEEAAAAHVLTCEIVADRAGDLALDLVHSHLEAFGLPLVRRLPMPIVTTLHLNPSRNGMPQLLAALPGAHLVAISDSQRGEAPAAGWVATIHHGLPLHRMPESATVGDYLLLVGRAAPEKGVTEAIEVARRSGMPLRIVAKAREPSEVRCLETVIRPAERHGLVTFLGELQSSARDEEFAGAYATLMLGDWPEPFGLVSIESMAAGTPVIARARGALPEIVRQGVDGFLVEDVGGGLAALDGVRYLDRSAIRRSALARFGVKRMVDEYEAVYRRLIGLPASPPAPQGSQPVAVSPQIALGAQPMQVE
jgi:glycosyltransferase involved in cell wall biosynthesis